MSLAVFPSDPSFGGSATPQPDQQSSYSVKPRINVVAFGDGYSQRTPDGLNTLRRVFSFSWKNIYSSQKVTIENFLIQNALRRNADLQNIRGRQAPKWAIHGVIRGGQGKPTRAESEFRRLMGL